MARTDTSCRYAPQSRHLPQLWRARPPTAEEEREWLRSLIRSYFRRGAAEQTLSTGQVASETISWA